MNFRSGYTILVLVFFRISESVVLPAGFFEKEVAKGLSSPVGMAIAPDNRVLVGGQQGTVWVLKNDSLLPEPMLTLKTDSHMERGLMGLALHPDFPSSPYLYIYYTALSPTAHNRLSRFPISGDRADASKEEVLFDLPEIGPAIYHMGGGLQFGADGKLYCGIGDHEKPDLARNPASPFGKILRVNPDGSIPQDNPFFDSASGIARAIWAFGLRNPFTLGARRNTGGIYAGDVGESSFEEVDEIVMGGNFGWPYAEGPSPDRNFLKPVFAYSHNDGCAITGGDFYQPVQSRFPAGYAGKYFFADFCRGWIRTVDPADGKVGDFLAGGSFPTGLRISPEGHLYYLSRGYATGDIKPETSKVFKVYYGTAGDGVIFSRMETGTGPGDPLLVLSGHARAGASMRIRLLAPKPRAIRLELRDGQGSLQAILADRPRFQGELDLSWTPGARNSEGIVFLVLKSGNKSWARKILYQKN